MFPIEIHDRGRGPELKGTRLTVYDVVPYRLRGYSAEQLAEVFRHGYPAITPAHVEALYRCMDENLDAVMAVHRKIEERNARGNPPEIESKLAQSRAKIAALREEFRGRNVGNVNVGVPPQTTTDKPIERVS